MYCPNCGKSTTTEQKFCRSCGLELAETAVSLLRQLPGPERAELLKREHLIDRFGKFALSMFGSAATFGLIALVYFILAEFVFSGRNPLLGVLFAAFIVSAVLLLAYVVMRELISKNPGAAIPVQEKPATADYLPPAVTARLDEGVVEPASVSVTDDSTDLLPVEFSTRK